MSNLKTKILIIIYFLTATLVSAQDLITVDLSRQYQTIDNFAASDCWSMQKIGEWVDSQKEKVADLLFSPTKGIGLSAWRFNIGAGINRATIFHEWRTVETFEVAEGVYDWTRQKEERWFLQAAKQRGVDQFIAFVNSPPARMTRNGYTNCSNGLGSTNLKEGYEGQFARYLADILKHFRDVWGIDFDYISPVNEPQWEWNIGCNQEGNRASNEDIKAIVDSLYEELQKNGLSTQILLVESGDLKSWYQEINYMRQKYGEPYGNYLTDLFSDTNIASKIAPILAGHSYGSDRIENQLVQDRQALFFKTLPFLNNGWKYWMTEYCILVGPEGNGGRGRDLTIKTALDVARVIHYDLTILRASAWQWWTAVSPEDYKDGLIYTNYKDNPSSQSIILSKLLWALGNYSRFIRPGSVMVKLTGASDKYGLLGSAFVTQSRDQLIIVFVNMSNSDKPVKISVTGLDSNKAILSFTPFITSDRPGDDLKEYPSFSAQESITIPSRSVVTLVGKIVDSTGFNTFEIENPNDYHLFQNFPNPFNGSTKIFFYLPEGRKAYLTIYSLRGEQIRNFQINSSHKGYQSVIWDGKFSDGKPANSGIYFYSLKGNEKILTKKMIYLQ